MTCKHCCGADQLFDIKSAQKELKSFRKKGAGKSTRKLLHLMAKYQYSRKSLLDIGGGIGAIQWEFFQYGGTKTTDVDASSGYIKVASEYAEEKKYTNANFIEGDFVDVAEDVDRHDFVTLDKVVCCYPDYIKLLTAATNNCTEVLALTMPLGGPISKMLSKLAALYMWITNNPFRAYVHDPEKVQTFIESRGFELSEKGFSFPWLIRVYERTDS